jgi:UDP-N-acetyl-2-amino-2-deoxyglucuronate dehydrogenase
METNGKIKFALIGYGSIGKRHAEFLMRNPETELVAICDPNPDVSSNPGIANIPVFDSLELMLNTMPDFEVLSIATPNGLHAEHALLAIESKKHVVIEKPMALKKTDCEEIIYKALQVNRHVFCIMQNRYSPPSFWIKSLLESGKLGKIYMVQINCYWNRDERYYKKNGWKGTIEMDGGTLYTQFSHFIDMMYWLFGDITDIQAIFRDFNHQRLTEFEDSGIVSFKFVKGGIGTFSYSTSIWDKNMESSIAVIAENGTVKISGQYMNEVEYCHVKDYVMPELPAANPPNDYGYYKGSAANHNYVFENVVDVLKGRTSIKTNALEGYKVVNIIEQIYALKKASVHSFFPEKPLLRPGAMVTNGMVHEL